MATGSWTDATSIEPVNRPIDGKRKVIGEGARMSREEILGVLFWSGVWGFSEATLGNALYSAGVPHASVPLTIIALAILTLARGYMPRPGLATLIAALAMLYKFLNEPFFACHLLGILLTGICYDVFFSVLRVKTAWLAAGLTTWASYAAFAVLITYVARYPHWVQGGITKVFEHVAVNGTLAALGCALLVPLSQRLGKKLRSAIPRPFAWRAALLPGSITGVAAGLWVLGLATYLLNHAA